MNGTPTYLASAGDNQVVSTCASLLIGIIFGKDVASSVVDVSDSVDDGDGNVQFHFEGSTLMTSKAGGTEINAVFTHGITVDMTNQTNVTVVWKPL